MHKIQIGVRQNCQMKPSINSPFISSPVTKLLCNLPTVQGIVHQLIIFINAVVVHQLVKLNIVSS